MEDLHETCPECGDPSPGAVRCHGCAMDAGFGRERDERAEDAEGRP